MDINNFDFVKEKVPGKFGLVTLNIKNSGNYKVMFEYVPVGDKEESIGNQSKTNFKEYQTSDEVHDWGDMEIILYLVDKDGKIIKSKAVRNTLYGSLQLEFTDEKTRINLYTNLARLWNYEELRFSLIYANGVESGLLQDAKIMENEYGVFYVEFPLIVNEAKPFEYYITSERASYGYIPSVLNSEEEVLTKLEFLKRYVKVMSMEESPLDVNSYNEISFIINDVFQVVKEAEERNSGSAIYNNSKMGELYYKEILNNIENLTTPDQLKELIQQVHEPFLDGFHKYNEYANYLQSITAQKYYWELPFGEQLKEGVTFEQVKKLYVLIDLIPEELQMHNKSNAYYMVGQIERNFYVDLENLLDKLRNHSMWEQDFSDETIDTFYSLLEPLEQQIVGIEESNQSLREAIIDDVEQIYYRLFGSIEQSIIDLSPELQSEELFRLQKLFSPYDTSIFEYFTERGFQYLLSHYGISSY